MSQASLVYMVTSKTPKAIRETSSQKQKQTNKQKTNKQTKENELKPGLCSWEPVVPLSLQHPLAESTEQLHSAGFVTVRTVQSLYR